MQHKIIFFTYGNGQNFKYSRYHLKNLAINSEIFHKTYSFKFNDIDRNFRTKYKYIFDMERGNGYWIWKVYFLKELLSQISNNDLIVYMDAGSIFNNRGRKRFFEYVDMLTASEFNNFRIKSLNGHIEKFYTVKETFDYFNIDQNSTYGNSLQFEAGHLIFKKDKKINQYIAEFFKAIDNDNDLITDRYNHNQEPYFIENRHDQSLLSILSKIYGCVSIDNETDFRENREIQYDYPFLALRRKNHGTKDKLKLITNYKKERIKPKYFI